MFVPEHWVAAFIDSLQAQGGETDEGLRALEVLAPWVASLPGAVFGSSAAEKLEKLIRAAMAAANAAAIAEGTEKSSPSLEVAVRFLVLMVKKNAIRHIGTVIDELKKFLDRKNGIVKATVEYVLPPEGGEESRIKEAVRERTGASSVVLTWQLKPELIGGFRLHIGDEVIDASIRSQLRAMEACLASGDGGN